MLLAISAVLFKNGSLNATTQTLCWVVVFFFASAGASAGYLTASEVFPLEVRAKAIAVFFAIAQLFGAFGSVVKTDGGAATSSSGGAVPQTRLETLRPGETSTSTRRTSGGPS